MNRKPSGWGRRTSLAFTRSGWITVILALGVGLSALNTGNNLLYIVFGGVLGLILASGLASGKNFQKLEADWIPPAEVYAGQPTLSRVIVRNAKIRASSIVIGFEIRFTGPSRFSWKGCLPVIPPRNQRHIDVSFSAPTRGLYTVESLCFSSAFPFGLFRKSMVLWKEGSLLVYPSINEAASAEIVSNGMNTRNVSERGESDSIWGLREFQAGDSLRRVSWKTSARMAKFVVTETEREMEPKILLALEPIADWRSLASPELEKAISFAASLACRLLDQNVAVGLVSGGTAVLPSVAPGQKARILRYLALFDPCLQTSAAAQHFSSLPVNVLSLWRSGTTGTSSLEGKTNFRTYHLDG